MNKKNSSLLLQKLNQQQEQQQTQAIKVLQKPKGNVLNLLDFYFNLVF